MNLASDCKYSLYIKESRVTYMTESVYTNQTEKFDLIVTTIKDIQDLNRLHINHHGFDDYTNYIAFAYRTCGLGIES